MNSGCRNILLLALVLMFMLPALVQAQGVIQGTVVEATSGSPIPNVEVRLEQGSSEVAFTNRNGFFELNAIPAGKNRVYAFKENYMVLLRPIEVKAGETATVSFRLQPMEVHLEEAVVQEQGSGMAHQSLRAVEGMQIFSGKKAESITVEATAASLAANPARQVFARTSGLNIWESDGAGLQLGVGGRGLSPNRTAHFNTRQNGYDIAADPLGYPESYYTPPMEAVQAVQVVRGAGALQYGTQFGGLLNFVLRQPPTDENLDIRSRQTYGSYGYFSSFNSVGGTHNGWGYYAFGQYRRGDGWRPNSHFEQFNGYAHVEKQFTERLHVAAEATHMQYLAQQPGGLTDAQFEQDPQQSHRDRNWFRVRWNLAALEAQYRFSPMLELHNTTFGLLASRKALGFLGNITRIDPLQERDLLSSDFSNWGNETRLLYRYRFHDRFATLLTGVRYYHGRTVTTFGPANSGYGADFTAIQNDSLYSSSHTFPGRNASAFIEHILPLTKRLNLTSGFRLEWIETSGRGSVHDVVTHPLTGEVLNEQTYDEDFTRERTVPLFGAGFTYGIGKERRQAELYGNITQNYRSITFNDLKSYNENLQVDPELHDERGWTAELGLHSREARTFHYDVSVFFMRYNERIGQVLMRDTLLWTTYRYRTNLPGSKTIGLEAYGEVALHRLLKLKKQEWTLFGNLSLLQGRYDADAPPAIAGNEVELVPPFIFRTGSSFGWGKFRTSFTWSYTGRHFSDATNAERSATAVEGIIPAYHVADFSAAYTWKLLTLEAGVSNVFNTIYFTRRATGYPGPGIIPAEPRRLHLTLGVDL